MVQWSYSSGGYRDRGRRSDPSQVAAARQMLVQGYTQRHKDKEASAAAKIAQEESERRQKELIRYRSEINLKGKKDLQALHDEGYARREKQKAALQLMLDRQKYDLEKPERERQAELQGLQAETSRMQAETRRLEAEVSKAKIEHEAKQREALERKAKEDLANKQMAAFALIMKRSSGGKVTPEEWNSVYKTEEQLDKHKKALEIRGKQVDIEAKEKALKTKEEQDPIQTEILKSRAAREKAVDPRLDAMSKRIDVLSKIGKQVDDVHKRVFEEGGLKLKNPGYLESVVGVERPVVNEYVTYHENLQSALSRLKVIDYELTSPTSVARITMSDEERQALEVEKQNLEMQVQKIRSSLMSLKAKVSERITSYVDEKVSNVRDPLSDLNPPVSTGAGK